MLSRTNFSLALSLLGSAVLFAGCIIKEGDFDDPPPTTTGNSTQSGGNGGNGGDGGSAGDPTGGGGGAGGAGGAGGSGGASAACLLDEPTVKDVKSCDNMNISPSTGASKICEAYAGESPDGDGPNNSGITGMLAPPGYTYCVRGFDIYTVSAAAYFQDCLSMIGVQDACDWDVAHECRSKMYTEIENKCPDHLAKAKELCVAYDAACKEQGDTSMMDKLDLCAGLLAPLSSKAGDQLNMCFDTDPGVTCFERLDNCEYAIREGL
jgi:hypothetical protein